MDELLNIEHLECDPLTRREKETPIHRAVAYGNERDPVELGEAMAKMLIEAGGDPRIKDKHGRKPADICTPKAEKIRTMLKQEEYVLNEGLKNAAHDDDEGPTGSASDSE
jgi:ankyrin repeat protein